MISLPRTRTPFSTRCPSRQLTLTCPRRASEATLGYPLQDFTFSTLRSRYTRAYYHYGAPLCPPDLPPGNCYDAYVGETETAAQQRLFADWWDQEKMRDAYDPKKSVWTETTPSAFITTASMLLQACLTCALATQFHAYCSGSFPTQELLAVAINDGILAVVPVIIVFFIVWLHTGSLLLASATLGEQFLSLLVALAVDAAVLQIKWIPFQHILSLYIVLAIGADDVFVFVDAWKQSFYAGPDVNRDLATRMSWVYRRAGLAMLITSLTTCASFIATAIASGQIPDLQNFGIFTALVIFIDYTLVMTWFTAIVVVWHNNFEMKPGLCCACCGHCTDGKCCKGAARTPGVRWFLPCAFTSTPNPGTFRGLQAAVYLFRPADHHLGRTTWLRLRAGQVAADALLRRRLSLRHHPAAMRARLLRVASVGLAGANDLGGHTAGASDQPSANASL